jgi:hypothetical protein
MTDFFSMPPITKIHAQPANASVNSLAACDHAESGQGHRGKHNGGRFRNSQRERKKSNPRIGAALAKGRHEDLPHAIDSQ